MLKTVGNPSTRYGNQTINDGNLVIGTANKGIDFSANSNLPGMTSELLNYYEEGTWTVTWGNLTGTPANLTGYYTKIGRLVFFTYATGTGSIIGSAGSVYFTLPFQPSKFAAGQQISEGVFQVGTTAIYPTSRVYCSTFSSAEMIFSGVYHV